MEYPEPVKLLESKGGRDTFLTGVNRQAFMTATQPILEKSIPKVGKDLYEKAKADMAK